jgi:hypothetical protein
MNNESPVLPVPLAGNLIASVGASATWCAEPGASRETHGNPDKQLSPEPSPSSHCPRKEVTVDLLSTRPPPLGSANSSKDTEGNSLLLLKESRRTPQAHRLGSPSRSSPTEHSRTLLGTGRARAARGRQM